MLKSGLALCAVLLLPAEFKPPDQGTPPETVSGAGRAVECTDYQCGRGRT
ncbi:MAG: hypothetical protein AAGE59_26820 [Cyanobacteria bacterium P01_F01_bin.86]